MSERELVKTRLDHLDKGIVRAVINLIVGVMKFLHYRLHTVPLLSLPVSITPLLR